MINTCTQRAIMNEVFDIHSLPERRLGIRKMVALDQHMHVEDAARIMRHDMAMQLATKILEGGPFFNESREMVGGHAMVEYRADCIVLTTDEYAALKREAFKDGVKHAQGSMTMPNF